MFRSSHYRYFHMFICKKTELLLPSVTLVKLTVCSMFNMVVEAIFRNFNDIAWLVVRAGTSGFLISTPSTT